MTDQTEDTLGPLVRQMTRITCAAGILAMWIYLVTVDVAAQLDPVAAEQMSALRERLARNEQVLYPTAESVTAIRVEIAAIKEAITAGKYLASVMTAAMVGQFMLAIYSEGRPRRRHRRDPDDDSGPIEVERSAD